MSLLDTASESAPNEATSDVKQEAGNQPAQGQDWRSHIPEDLRSEKGWEKYKDVGSALKSLHHLEKRMGSAINIPGEGAKPEEVSAFYEKLGVPKAHADYKITEPQLPQGLSWEKESLGKFAEAAHKLHLTPSQLQGVLDFYGSDIAAKNAMVAKQNETNVETIKKEWGTDFQSKVTDAKAAIAAYDSNGEFLTALKQSGLDSDPRVVKFLQRIGSDTGEKPAKRGTHESGLTREQAAEKVREFQSAPKDHPLYNKKHPQHNDAVKQYKEMLLASVDE